MWKALLFLFASLSAEINLLEIGKASLQVEIAHTPQEMRKGLSGRDNLPEDKGMLFIYDRPQKVSFWMKDTRFPLSIGFFDEDRILFQIEDMSLVSNKIDQWPVYSSRKPVLYALEVNRGWFEQNGIKPGMKFSLSQIESIR